MTPLTTQEKKEHEESDIFYICEKVFVTNEKHPKYSKLKKVMDHDHYTGKYRGAAHSICNLRYRTQTDIPVVIHNGSNYDFKLLMRHFAKYFKEDIRCIAENTEKYMTFSIEIKYEKVNDKWTRYNLKFIDSYRFMTGSLDKHVNNLSELFDCNCENKKEQVIKLKHEDNIIHSKCKTCHKRFKQDLELLKEKFKYTYTLCNDDISKFLLLLRKGVYPYEYMNDWNKFSDTELPSHNAFYSSLKETNITKQDYNHVKKVWYELNAKIWVIIMISMFN